MTRHLTAATALAALLTAAQPAWAQEVGRTQDDIGGIYEGTFRNGL